MIFGGLDANLPTRSAGFATPGRIFSGCLNRKVTEEILAWDGIKEDQKTTASFGVPLVLNYLSLFPKGGRVLQLLSNRATAALKNTSVGGTSRRM